MNVTTGIGRIVSGLCLSGAATLLALGLARSQSPAQSQAQSPAQSPSGANPASASASAWTAQKYGPIRLISGTPRWSGFVPAPGKLYAGIHIRLDDGWKTYWRLPGDSGVPPGFEWTGSTNLADARVLFPVPARLPEAGMISLGYKREVVFPVEITPRDAGKPVELQLAAEYGVCKDICIPAEGRVSLQVPTDVQTGEGALIAAHLARVPRRAVPGAPAIPGAPTIQRSAYEASGAAPRLIIDAIFPDGGDGADALVEVPGGELAPLAVITSRNGRDAVRFEVRFASVSEAQRFAGKTLVVTLLSATGQAEVPIEMSPQGRAQGQ